MMSDPSENDGPKPVRRDELPPNPLYPDLASDSELEMTPAGRSGVRIFAFIALFILIAVGALFAWLWMSERSAERRQATIEGEAGQRSPTPAPSVTPPAWASGNIAPVFPEMLKVTSIAMGKPPLAIVNGTRLAQGEWLDVKTSHGTATLVVEKIDDGVVHFRNGEVTIDAKLPARFTPKPLQ